MPSIDYLGLTVAVHVTGARTHEVRAARELLAGVLPDAERVTTVMGDRGFRGLAGPLEREYGIETVIKHDPDRPEGEFRPLKPLWRVEAAFRARPLAPVGAELRGHHGLVHGVDAGRRSGLAAPGTARLTTGLGSPAVCAVSVVPGTIGSVIASAKQAKRYGTGRASGLLLVDGHDETVFRKAEIGLKPATRKQRRSLLALLDASREVYNAALQERRDAYAHGSKTRVALFDQFNQVTDLRGVRDDVLGWGIQPLRWSMRRVDEAFGAFFARVSGGSSGKAVGYPRFKGHGRWNTVGWDETTGWKLNLDGTRKDPRPHFYVLGIGNLPLSKPAVRQLRRYVVRGGVPTTLTLTRANREGSAWRAAVGFKNLAVQRMTEPTLGPNSIAGVDRGIAVLVAAASADGYAADPGKLLHHAADLEQRLEGLRTEIEDLQRQREAKKKYGRAWRTLSKRVKRLHSKAAHITENWARHTAKQLVAQHAMVVVEDLNLKNMTKSAKGTVEAPGRNVAAKAGLNRSLAEAAPGKLAKWVHVKAENAGRRTWAVPSAYTSQQCAACGVIDAAARVNRETYYCGSCGHYEHADVNAARNIRARGLAAEQAWREVGSPLLERPKPRLRRRKNDATPPAELAA